MLGSYRPARRSRAGSLSVDQSVPAHAMAAASRLFARAHGPTAMLTDAARELAAEPGQLCLVSLSDATGQLQPIAVEHRRPATSRQLRSALQRAQGESDAFSLTAQRTGRSVRVPIEGPSAARLWLPPAYWAYAQKVGLSCALAAPLARFGKVVGTLMLLREGDQPPYTAEQEAFLSGLAARLALGLPVNRPAAQRKST